MTPAPRPPSAPPPANGADRDERNQPGRPKPAADLSERLAAIRCPHCGWQPDTEETTDGR